MHHRGQITTIIQNHIRAPAISANDGLTNTPDSFFFGFTFPGKDRDALIGNSRCSVILC